MKRLLLVLILVCAVSHSARASGGTCPSGANYLAQVEGQVYTTLANVGITNCYFFSVSGSNVNTGTSEAAPLASLPGMPNCTGVCASLSPSAGTGLILKSGESWGISYFGISWKWAGTAANPIYISEDPTWGTGAQPVWTCGGTNCNGATAVMQIFDPYTILDNIEITGQFYTGTATNTSGPNIINVYTHDVTVERVYWHGISFTTPWLNTNITTSATLFNQAGGEPSYANNTFRFNVCNFSDSNGPNQAIGSCSGPVSNAYGNYMYGTLQGLDGCGDNWHDNIVDHMGIPVDVNVPNASFHQNAYKFLGNCYNPVIFFYNNVVVNQVAWSGAGGAVKFWVLGGDGSTATEYIFGNVSANNPLGNSFNVGGQAHTVNPFGTGYIFNNTIECGTDSGLGLCTIGNGEPAGSSATLFLENNHWITTASSVFTGLCTNGGWSCTETKGLYQTIAQANAQGYTSTSTYPFQPTSAVGATVATVGASISANCSAINAVNPVAGAACGKGTTYGCTYISSNHTMSCPNLNPATRALAGPNLGAYQFTNGNNPPPPPQPSIVCNGQTSYNFGSIAINTTASAVCTLSNSGSVTLNVSIQPSGTGFSEAVGGTCATTLAGGQSCTVNVQFAPTTAGSYSGALTETDSTNNVSASIQLSGTGTSPGTLSITPGTLSFGNQPQGTKSASLTATLTNVGGSPVTLATGACPGASCFYQIGGANAADFSVVKPTAPTWTITQHKLGSCGYSNVSGGTFTCTATLSSNVTAGHSLAALLAVWNAHTSTYPTTPTHNATSGDSDTWQRCPSSIQSIFHVTTGLPYQMVLDCDYVPVATGGGNTVTMSYSTQSGSGIYLGEDIEVIEFVPSTGSVSIDNGNTIASPPTNCTSCSGPSLTIGGTSDLVFPWSADADVTYSGSPINSPYTVLDTDNANVQASFAYATNQSSVTTPVWTMGGAGNWTGSILAFTASAVSNSCGSAQVLQSGSTCNIQGTFTPSTSGLAETGSLTITANGGALTTSAALTGTGTSTSQAALPAFSPVGGTYTSTQTPSITSATGGAVILYTVDGSAPGTQAGSCTGTGSSAEILNGGTITVSVSQTVKALACASGYANSAIATANYVIQAAQSTVALPTTSLASGSYVGSQSVALSSGTSGAKICYRLDGGMPTAGTPGTCDAPATSLTNGSSVSITTSEALTFIGTQSGFINSAVVTVNYSIYAGAPTFSPNGGIYPSAASFNVTVTSSTGGTIWYTTDLSRPTCSHGTSISSGGSITITPPETVFAVTCQTGFLNSGVAGAVYTPYIPAPAVAFAMLHEPSLVRMP
jgi:hypothetical protein